MSTITDETKPSAQTDEAELGPNDMGNDRA